MKSSKSYFIPMVTFWAWAIFATAQVAPNVLFFLVDDFGYMDVGANHPGTFYETPHIDSLAAEGMRFTHGYAANPICSPTRYSIMTGKYPTRAGATQFFSGKRSGRYAPIPFKEAGYETFFAYLSFYSVTPLMANAALVAKYRQKAGKLGLDRQEVFQPEEQVWPNAKSPRMLRPVQSHATYAAMVESMDSQVGRVLDALTRWGSPITPSSVSPRTMVAFQLPKDRPPQIFHSEVAKDGFTKEAFENLI